MAMDETSVCNEMVSNTTIDKEGVKSVCLKTTGHEKYMVSVYLAAKVNGTKLKPFVVFPAFWQNLNDLMKNSNPVLY